MTLNLMIYDCIAGNFALRKKKSNLKSVLKLSK